jgi:hypothetical protein
MFHWFRGSILWFSSGRTLVPDARTASEKLSLVRPDVRGRDEDFSSPPAQIPACAANAPGSSLGSDVV